ncbi:uncharacterized protein LOC143041415 [Oratosquilla oratoria]|uniref:uncharacterized protein LOC143041415 n=1 Tax=Oratosquilla oratoria TaxID=337810 RepID=UPI003F75DD0E
MASDSDKMIKKQLQYLVHACNCLETENSSCKLDYCKFFKEILVHMSSCTEGRTCEKPHCVSSREVVSHWQNCAVAKCTLCSSVLASNGDPVDSPAPQLVRFPTFPVWQGKPAFFLMWLSLSPKDKYPEDEPTGYPELKNRSEAARLMLMLHHGHNCSLRKSLTAAECKLKTCPPIKKLLSHMRLCNDGFTCSNRQCITARSVMVHWQECRRIFCALCSPVRPRRSKSF